MDKITDLREGDTVELKRTKGRLLKHCEVEDIRDEGFVYYRRTRRGYYSWVKYSELEHLRKEGVVHEKA